MLRREVRRFAEERILPGVRERDRAHTFPADLLREAEKGNDVVVNLNVGVAQKAVKKTEEAKPETSTPARKKKTT